MQRCCWNDMAESCRVSAKTSHSCFSNVWDSKGPSLGLRGRWGRTLVGGINNQSSLLQLLTSHQQLVCFMWSGFRAAEFYRVTPIVEEENSKFILRDLRRYFLVNTTENKACLFVDGNFANTLQSSWFFWSKFLERLCFQFNGFIVRNSPLSTNIQYSEVGSVKVLPNVTWRVWFVGSRYEKKKRLIKCCLGFFD